MHLICCKKTVRYLDYGHYEGKETGLAWFIDGQYYGFERGDFETLLAQKRARIEGHEGWSISVGAPIVRTVDINPHGLM